jgi:dTDP-4-amino-4,6-dideoxygalactose transaminase
MPVHLFGQPVNMQVVMDVARGHNLHVIEDAACALGSMVHGQYCGTFGEIGCYSYHPRKIVTTGEGGMLVTNDDDLADRLRQLRNHGLSVGGFIAAGFNYRLTDMQGALGLAQMEKLDAIIEKRRWLVGLYQEALSDIEGVRVPFEIPDGRHTWQAFVVLLDENLKRDVIIDVLRQNGIESNIGTYAVSVQTHYAAHHKPLPNSTTAYRQSLCLPLSSRLNAEDIATVTEKLHSAITSRRQ